MIEAAAVKCCECATRDLPAASRHVGHTAVAAGMLDLAQALREQVLLLGQNVCGYIRVAPAAARVLSIRGRVLLYTYAATTEGYTYVPVSGCLAAAWLLLLIVVEGRLQANRGCHKQLH